MLNKNDNPKIKILHVVQGMRPNGLETLIMNWFRVIDKEKYQFDFAVHTEEKCYYDEEIKALGGRIISHPSPKKQPLKFKRQFKKTLKEYGPYDVVHSHTLNFSGLVLKVANMQNVPVRIAHSHSVTDNRSNSLFRKLYRNQMRNLINSNATHKLGCSKLACENLFGEKSLNETIVFPNAIRTERYLDLNKSIKESKNSLGLEEWQTVAGHVGRFSKVKNHLFILEVFEEAIKQDPNIQLLLIGDGEKKQEIVRKATEKDLTSNIHFLGIREDIPDIMNAMDIFLLPSYYEGLGIVLIEAQAIGVPCLVSNGVPKEADLRINLFTQRSLDNSINVWKEELFKLIGKRNFNKSLKKNALKNSGYDINESVEKLESIYEDKIN